MVRFYSNENFPLPVVLELRRLGHDVLTIQEAGQANKEYPDDEILNAAGLADRIILTVNRKDFIRLHRKFPEHRGIIICTTDNDFSGLAKRIDDTVQTIASFEGQLVRVNRPQR